MCLLLAISFTFDINHRSVAQNCRWMLTEFKALRRGKSCRKYFHENKKCFVLEFMNFSSLRCL